MNSSTEMETKLSDIDPGISDIVKLPEGIRGDMPYETALQVFRACLQSADREYIYIPDELCKEFDINPMKENGSKTLKEIVTKKPKVSTRDRLLKKLEDRKTEEK